MYLYTYICVYVYIYDGATGRFFVALEGNSLQLKIKPTNFRL